MTAYAIMIREHMRDETAFARYATLAREASADHPVIPLAFYGKHEAREGPPANGVVILSFPDLDAARAWYDSPEYAKAKEQRHLGADYRVLFVEGLQ